MKGLEPPRRKTPDPKSGAATITPHPEISGTSGNRTSVLWIFSPTRAPATPKFLKLNKIQTISVVTFVRDWQVKRLARLNEDPCIYILTLWLLSILNNYFIRCPNLKFCFELPLRFELRFQDYKSSVLTN